MTAPTVYMKDIQGFQLVAATCVTHGGTYVGDGWFCEPSSVRSGASFGNEVITGVVLPLPAGATSGTASVTVCVDTLDLNPDPDLSNNCRTLTVKVYPY